MTHDELMAKVSNYKDAGFAHLVALRAVVALHSSFTPEFGGGMDYCWADDRPYPCPTIQAIEKELK